MGKIKDKFASILYPPGVTHIDGKQATALFLILFSTQLTLTTPFSYLPAMVTSFGYKDRDRGYYAGMIASSLFVGRFFGGYFWGWLTDKYGRRPILLISASLTYIATVAFGFTTNIYWALATRFFQGLFNGVIVVGRAAFAEICDDTNQAIGVSLVFAAWNSAIVLGPALGGFLAEPVKKYPKVFHGASETFFTKFAYLLPSVMIATILLLGIFMIYFLFPEPSEQLASQSDDTDMLLEETEASNDELKKPDGENQTYHMVDQDEKATTSKFEDANTKSVDITKCTSCCNYVTTSSLFLLISDKYVVLVTIIFGISGFCIIGFSELRSLWMATNVKYGGLSFSTDKIGIALLVPALVAVIMQPIIFGRLERKLGGIWTLRITLIILACCTGLFPFIHVAFENKALVWSLLVILGIFRMISDISSRSCIALFINNVVYRDQAGRANGFAFSVQEIMRVASPTLFGSLFAWAINDERHKVVFPLDYRLPFFIITLFLLLILLLSLMLPKRVNEPKQVVTTGTAISDDEESVIGK